jgi:O-acetyl-ADP-ribose deacetylase (regulator of RNase III)
VQQQVIEQFGGEQPVGTSIIVETKHPKHPFLAHTPTMRVPLNVADTDHAYQATWAMLNAVRWHNKTQGRKIDSVLCPGLGTGVGAIDVNKAAYHMALAYERFLSPPEQIDWNHADRTHFGIIRHDYNSVVEMLETVRNSHSGFLPNLEIPTIISFLNGVNATLSITSYDRIRERRIVQRRGWAYETSPHYAYQMQEKGMSQKEILDEVIEIHIEAVKAQYN